MLLRGVVLFARLRKGVLSLTSNHGLQFDIAMPVAMLQTPVWRSVITACIGYYRPYRAGSDITFYSHTKFYTMRAVSYTHLDVYKRQFQQSLAVLYECVHIAADLRWKTITWHLSCVGNRVYSRPYRSTASTVFKDTVSNGFESACCSTPHPKWQMCIRDSH